MPERKKKIMPGISAGADQTGGRSEKTTIIVWFGRKTIRFGGIDNWGCIWNPSAVNSL
jgi:hypothetical protein